MPMPAAPLRIPKVRFSINMEVDPTIPAVRFTRSAPKGSIIVFTGCPQHRSALHESALARRRRSDAPARPRR